LKSGETDITMLIQQWQAGDPEAVNKLVERIYPELKKIAGAILKNERRNHTLAPTALVNELYLKFIRSFQMNADNRTQFFALAAQSARNILVDYARLQRAKKRGGSDVRITLSAANLCFESKAEDLLSVDEALRELQRLDSRAAQVVELRFFGGLSEVEVAGVLGVSKNTVQRDWSAARAWLIMQLGKVGPLRQRVAEL
jgi:RNA polymerase sigma-70 factor (ECF subfamily)